MDTHAEGLQFKAIKVIEAGQRNEAVWSILRDNIRASSLVVGDMEAQVRTTQIGAERYSRTRQAKVLKIVMDAVEISIIPRVMRKQYRPSRTESIQLSRTLMAISTIQIQRVVIFRLPLL